MTSIKEVRTATITSKGQIAIPKSARSVKGFSIGSKVSILVYDNRVELRPLKQVAKSLFNALASERVLARDWDTKEEDEAWKDL